MGWLEDEVGDLSGIVGSATLRRRGGRWCAVVRVRVTGDDGAVWTQRTRDTQIPCGKVGDEAYEEAMARCLHWRDEVLVSEVLARAQVACDRRVASMRGTDAATPWLGVGFDEYAAHYLDVLRSTAAVSPETLRGYRGEAFHMISPRMPDKAISAITTEDIESVMAALLGAGYSTGTVKKCMNLLGAMFKRAVMVDGLVRSPCEGVRPPAPDPPRQNALSGSGWSSLLETLASMRQTPVVCAARLALLLGLTREEVCALTWRDWDLAEETGVLRITSAVARAETGYERRKPKTSARIRSIPITKAAREAGAARRLEAEAECAATGEAGPGADDYVIGHPDGTWFSPGALTHGWSTLCKANGWVGERGLPLTFHDLRHTFATRLVASGADVKSASRIMGHSTPSTTLKVYASEDAAAKRRAMDSLEGALDGNGPQRDDERIVGMLAKAIKSAIDM